MSVNALVVDAAPRRRRYARLRRGDMVESRLESFDIDESGTQDISCTHLLDGIFY